MTTAFALLALVLGAVPPAEADLIVKAKVLHLGDGRVLKDAVVVVADGKIAFVGAALPAGTTAKETVEVADAHVTPGFVEGSTHAGLPRGASENEEGSETTPNFRVSRAVDASSEAFDRLLDVGVTTMVVVPGNRNSFGGVGAAMKPREGGLQKKLLRDGVMAQAVATTEAAARNSPPGRGFFSRGGPGLFNRRPTTRLGVVFELRRGLNEGAGAVANPEWKSGFDDATTAGLASIVKGDLPLAFVVGNDTDCLAAVRIAEEFGVKRFYLQDAGEAARCAKVLAAKKVSALIGAATFQEFPTSFSARANLMAGPKVLADAGVRFALSRGSWADGATLRDFAVAAVRGGLDPAKAIAAVTGDAAKILGLSDRVGLLEAGRDADLLVFSGDPLSPSSRLAAVVLDGRVVRRADRSQP